MAAEPGNRRLLPQSSQMQSYQFAPNVVSPPQANQKNYVFVDEHNRHKRLKVMRACEGCRRRKIKCDAATTNTWPCSACVRLKLHCVPPTVNYDQDGAQDAQNYGSQGLAYTEAGSLDDGYRQQVSMQQQMTGASKGVPPIYTQPSQYQNAANVYQSIPYGETSSSNSQQSLQYGTLQTPVSILDQQQQYPAIYSTPTLTNQPSTDSANSYDQEPYAQEDLADLLGSLKMDAAGTAPYLNTKSANTVGEEPAFEDVDEFKVILPPTLSGPDKKIRIPPELMPDEETILHYFNVYFTDVHPYVPVLNKASFYQQWQNSRDTISPLILEAIFAIAGRLLDEPAQGHQWLALASKHADSFMDKPRLSTLQAMLIVLKARESAPKRGYYFRSWMTVVACVQMGKDLGLNEHYDDHKAGRSCGSNMADCVTKIRIWHTIFVCELMIGSPQGRTDLAVVVDTLDWRIQQRQMQGIDDIEYSISRNWIYFAKVVLNIRKMNDVYARVKKKKEWGIDPEMENLSPNFDAWIKELPQDLQISFPADGSPPWLPTHFIGNLHSYYYLSIIMYNRPQLAFKDSTAVDGAWKHHMMICYSSAKLLCRLQEAILQAFGLTGLLCMQRGINFTIYCVLTCTVLHLVALTSPDPDLCTDAREYFTRHMRILERCTSSWPMPDMQQQIDALREAFSADVRKPFVLNPSFPYRSPRGPGPSPPRGNNQYRPPGVSSVQQQPVHTYSSHPISPPVSAGTTDSRNESPAGLGTMASNQRIPQQQQQMATNVPMGGVGAWNPTRIFDQWNSTFGTPPPAHIAPPAPVPGTDLKTSVSGAQDIPTLPEVQNMMNMPTGAAQPMPQQQYSAATIPTFVSPSMWQESVASVYEGALKRSWDYGDGGMINAPMKRTR